jgi:hypothetical protein
MLFSSTFWDEDEMDVVGYGQEETTEVGDTPRRRETR